MASRLETYEAGMFEHWMRKVEALLQKFGVPTDDLDRGPWREYFDDGFRPEDAVREDACL